MSDRSHLIHLESKKSYPRAERGRGVYIFDDQGRSFLDGAGGAVSMNLGHGSREMAQAIGGQAERLSFAFRYDWSNGPAEELAGKISEQTHGALEGFFFTSGGSEANEICLKLARSYFLAKGEPRRYKVISRWHSYHGMTMAVLSLSGNPNRRADSIPYLFEHGHIPPAYCYRCWYGKEPRTCALECAQALEDEILMQGPESVAAFIAEPVSGSSLCGAYPENPGYFRRIQEICRKYGVLFILDEVMSGYGRTGKMFACRHFGVWPDIMSLAKGISGGYFPLGAAAASPEVTRTIRQKDSWFGVITWFGNPMGAAAGLKTLEILQRDHLVERSAEMGLYLRQKLEELKERHPLVGDVRGLGLMQGLEFVADKKSKAPLDPALGFYGKVKQACLEQGLIVMAVGGNVKGGAGDMVLLGPPFVISREEIDRLAQMLDKGLAQAAAGLEAG